MKRMSGGERERRRGPVGGGEGRERERERERGREVGRDSWGREGGPRREAVSSSSYCHTVPTWTLWQEPFPLLLPSLSKL